MVALIRDGFVCWITFYSQPIGTHSGWTCKTALNCRARILPFCVQSSSRILLSRPTVFSRWHNNFKRNMILSRIQFSACFYKTKQTNQTIFGSRHYVRQRGNIYCMRMYVPLSLSLYPKISHILYANSI